MKNSNEKSKVKRGIFKGEKPLKKIDFRLVGKTFFITYKGTTDTGQKLTKESIANFLMNENQENQNVYAKVKPQKYLVCQQMYDSGEPHFHVVLIYQKRKQIKRQDYFDFLGVHPNIQIMRNMKAALDYVYKQDPHPYTNMDVIRQKMVARAKNSKSLYQLLEQQMLKDVFSFDVDKYCVKNNLYRQIYKADFRKAVYLIKRAQPAYAKFILSQKPGIKYIDQNLIREKLSQQQLKQYYSHSCYQRIIDHVNQIYQYPNRDRGTMAPSKTPHLLIVGDASIGKSALVDHRPTPQYPYPGLMHYYATYFMNIGQKFFPPYRSFDYRLVRWNQFVINSSLFPKARYNELLDYLQGAPSSLPQKGRPAVQRQDNPKHILTSNRTLLQHIYKTFKTETSRAISIRNLGTRIDCVQVPLGKNLHFLRKLFVPAPPDPNKVPTEGQLLIRKYRNAIEESFCNCYEKVAEGDNN